MERFLPLSAALGLGLVMAAYPPDAASQNAGTVVGPFTVAAGATPEQVETVRSAVALIDSRIVGRDPAGRVKLSFGKPPEYKPGHTAWGYSWRAKPGRAARSIINDGLNPARQTYTIVHEYAHQWDNRYGTPAMHEKLGADMVPPVPSGGWKKGDYTSRPSEVFADTAAESWTRGAITSMLEADDFWKRDYPDSLKDKFLDSCLELAGTPDDSGNPGSRPPADSPGVDGGRNVSGSAEKKAEAKPDR